MSAYVVDSATIDGIVAGALQYGRDAGPGFSFHRFFADTATDRGGYSAHKFSPYASADEAPEVFNPETMGRELWTENIRSIHARYPDTVDGEGLPGVGDFSEVEALAYEYGPGSRVLEVDPFGLLGVISGYEYQACEHDGWKSSISFAFCQALRGHVGSWLGKMLGSNEWTIDDVAEIEGQLVPIQGEGGAWSLRFTPGRGEARSLLSMMTRGR